MGNLATSGICHATVTRLWPVPLITTGSRHQGRGGHSKVPPIQAVQSIYSAEPRPCQAQGPGSSSALSNGGAGKPDNTDRRECLLINMLGRSTGLLGNLECCDQKTRPLPMVPWNVQETPEPAASSRCSQCLRHQSWKVHPLTLTHLTILVVISHICRCNKFALHSQLASCIQLCLAPRPALPLVPGVG